MTKSASQQLWSSLINTLHLSSASGSLERNKNVFPKMSNHPSSNIDELKQIQHSHSKKHDDKATRDPFMSCLPDRSWPLRMLSQSRTINSQSECLVLRWCGFVSCCWQVQKIDMNIINYVTFLKGDSKKKWFFCWTPRLVSQATLYLCHTFDVQCQCWEDWALYVLGVRRGAFSWLHSGTSVQRNPTHAFFKHTIVFFCHNHNLSLTFKW